MRVETQTTIKYCCEYCNFWSYSENQTREHEEACKHYKVCIHQDATFSFWDRLDDDEPYIQMKCQKCGLDIDLFLTTGILTEEEIKAIGWRLYRKEQQCPTQ